MCSLTCNAVITLGTLLLPGTIPYSRFGTNSIKTALHGMDEYHHRLLLKNATSAQDTKATVITAEVELHHYVIHWKMGMIFKTLQPGNNNVCF